MPNSQADVTAGAPNLESYTDNGDGTVTDNVTGLMWQQAVPATTYTWANAVAYCPTLTLAGHTDWRLPSLIELVSILDVGTMSPPINGTYFPSTPASYFWSSSPVVGLPSQAWTVYFIIGWMNSSGVFYVHNVRCVRSASADASPPPGRYVTDSTNGTVYDTKTKLTWQRTYPSTLYTWADAKTYCAGKGTGWRLPTIKELVTIVDYSQASYAPMMIDPNAFPGTLDADFWSSSPFADPSFAWFISFSVGVMNYNFTSVMYPVRCVR